MTPEEALLCRDLGLLQPPRRGRGSDVAYHQEHVERLSFVKRALSYGFTVEDVEDLIDPDALVTCHDVYEVAARRLEAMRESEPDAAEVAALERLAASCVQTGTRHDCRLLGTLSQGRSPAGDQGER